MTKNGLEAKRRGRIAFRPRQMARSALAGSLLLAAGPAWNAETVDGPVSQQGGGGGSAVDDVVVTATRRQEPLQKVPLAVTVVEGEQAAAQNLNALNDIATEVPALNFRDGASNKDRSLIIRGMGTITTSPGVEPSVSTVIDGVPLDRPGQATLDLLDVDHIEVLRGPQGTLFGKNASAGVINIVTRQPTEEVHGYADLSYFGEDNEIRGKAGISGALIPGKMSGLLTVLGSQYDGNVRNIRNDEDVNGYSHNGASAKLLLTPTDAIDITVAADYLHSRDTSPTGVVTGTTVRAYPSGLATASPALAAIFSPVSPDASNRTVNADTNSSTDDENGGIAATLEARLGAYRLTSISAYRRWRNTQIQDGDRTAQVSAAIPRTADRGDLDFHQISQEIRLTSPEGRFLEYVSGLYYQHAVDNENYRRDVLQVSGAGLAANYGNAHFGTEGDNYSLFAEGTLNFTDDFRAISGARVIGDELSYYHQRYSTQAAAFPGVRPSIASSGSTSDTGFADRFGLQYDLARGVTSYATYSRGYKGPAYNVFFNMQGSDTGALKAETSNSYEVGLKSRLFDDRFSLDLAAFHTDFANYQANFPDLVNGTVVTRLINAGDVSSRGVEADLRARPTDRLTLRGGLAATDAHIDRFNCPPGSAASCNVNGKPLPFAPNWKADLRGDYRIFLDDRWDIVLGSDFRWQSKVQYDISQSPDTIQGAFGIWNADVTLANLQDGWRFAVLAKNILDKHYASYLQSTAASSAPGSAGYVYRWVPRDDSRYFGVALRKEF